MKRLALIVLLISGSAFAQSEGSGGALPATCTTASVATSGNVATFEGVWINGANAGNVQMRFKSEVAVASAIVIQAGSWCRYNVY